MFNAQILVRNVVKTSITKLKFASFFQNYGFVEVPQENMFEAVTVSLIKLKKNAAECKLDYEDVDMKFQYLKNNGECCITLH